MADLRLLHEIDLDDRTFERGATVTADAGTARALVAMKAAEIIRYGEGEAALALQIEEEARNGKGSDSLMHGGPVSQRGESLSRVERRRQYKQMGGVIGVRFE